MVSYYDELEIEDFTWDEDAKVFHYPCPCGDRFEISKGQLRDGEEIATCPSCSLIVRVIYDYVSCTLATLLMNHSSTGKTMKRLMRRMVQRPRRRPPPLPPPPPVCRTLTKLLWTAIWPQLWRRFPFQRVNATRHDRGVYICLYI